MKKTYFLFIVVMLIAFNVKYVNSQHMVVNQVIVGSGGIYGDTTNFVSLASFNPNGGSTTTFGSIKTQSIQDVVISGNFAFIAAQDSIAKFDIDTYEKVAVVAAAGVNQLFVNGDILLASFQFPVTENFVKVYSSVDLNFISNVSDISDESAGMLVVGNLAYAAVPGGWESTIGKIAIIDLSDYSLVDEINFNEQGVGVYDLFYYDNKIMSVNRTPWGGYNGFVMAMNMLGTHTEVYQINESLGKMVGVTEDLLFTVMNDGVGIIDLEDFSVFDEAFIQAPTLSIAAAVLDTINELFYITTTDYYSTGVGTIYNALGIETGSFDAGISADAIAIDYRDNTGIADLLSDNNIKIYPNPSSTIITVEIADGLYSDSFKIVDVSGRVLMNAGISLRTGGVNIDISTLESGLYFLVLSDGNTQITSSFVKK